MIYKCICGVYVTGILRLCRVCGARHGNDWRTWPVWVGLRYAGLNFGGDYAWGTLDKYGRPTYLAGEPIGKKNADVKGVSDPIFEELGRKQCPVCHSPINVKERLCKVHYIEFGGDRANWPRWLQALVTDDQRIIDAARDHREYSVDDETPATQKAIEQINRQKGGSLGGRTTAKFNPHERSQEVIDWGDDLGGSETDNRLHELEGYEDRDQLENKIALDQELEQSDYTRQNVILLYGAGYSQNEIAELLKTNQQRVSEILSKSSKRQKQC